MAFISEFSVLKLKREENMSKLERMKKAENSNTKDLSSEEK
jgi:hypothetical protein